VQLDLSEHPPLAADSVAESARAGTDGNRSLVTGAAQAGSISANSAVLLGRHRQFRWAIINPAGLNTGSN